MKPVSVRKRSSGPFYPDDRHWEAMPAFRSDGIQIDNEIEWQIMRLSQISTQIAHEMLIEAIAQNRKIHKVNGDDIRIGFHFVMDRESAPGQQMIVVCVVTRYE